MSNFSLNAFGRKSAIELFRYGLFGIISNSIGYLIYLLLTYLGATPKITISLLYAVGVAISFWGNRKWTFMHNGSQTGASLRYMIAYGIGYFINLAILIVMVDKFGYTHQWVQAVAIFVVAAFLFLAFKFYVFTNIETLKKDAQ